MTIAAVKDVFKLEITLDINNECMRCIVIVKTCRETELI